MKRIFDSPLVGYILALFSGLVAVAAYAPFSYNMLMFFCLALLYHRLEKTHNNRQAFFTGFYFGCGYFGAGVSWVYVSLSTYGNMVPAMAIAMVIVFVVYLSLFFALCCYLYRRYFSHFSSYWRLLFIMPALWVIFEALREYIMTGFPWLSLGYSQTDSWLSASAPIVGVLGVSFVTAIMAGIMLYIIRADTFKAGFRWIGLMFCIYMAHLALLQISWVEPAGEPIHTKLVQGNVSLIDKWTPSEQDNIFNKYQQLSQQGEILSGDKTQYIIWPEAAIPQFADQVKNSFASRVAQQDDQVYITGILERDSKNLFNSIAIFQNQQDYQSYQKRHLVPFGEFIPFKSIISPILTSLEIPMSDLSPNPDAQSVIKINDINFGFSICYEDAFPMDIRHSLKEAEQQADVLLNVSEDAWFGRSFGPHQRLQMAQMRTKEMQRYMIRVSNNGLSSIIDNHGKILQQAPQFEIAVMDASVPLLKGQTPFARFGHLIILMIIGLGFIALAITSRVRSKK